MTKPTRKRASGRASERDRTLHTWRSRVRRLLQLLLSGRADRVGDILAA